jgi:hypothetical protein
MTWLGRHNRFREAAAAIGLASMAGGAVLAWAAIHYDWPWGLPTTLVLEVGGIRLLILAIRRRGSGSNLRSLVADGAKPF